MKFNFQKRNQCKAAAYAMLCTCFIVGSPLNIQAKSAESTMVMQQQKVQISGNVNDENGEPIAGANILVKGTTNGCISDANGKFTLKAAPDAVLRITYIGYESKDVVAKAGEPMSITMSKSDRNLDEVVVVGYGVQKKSDITGSVTSVPKSRLEKLPVTNIMQAIQGVTAGVTVTQSSSIPGDAPTTLVRGQGSINASTSPYIVVDGIPISKSGGSLNDINPGDIASVEILKDASSTAIYGTNGANGVILITTKRGVSGKPSISYNGYVGFEQIAHILKPRNAEEYLQKYKDWLTATNQVSSSPVPNYGELDNYKAGITRDWIADVSQDGLVQNHNVSISGGAEKIKYYIAADYENEQGVLKGYQYKRYGIRSNMDINVTNYLTVGTNIYGTFHNKDGGRVNLLVASAMSPYGEKYNDDGTYKIYPMEPEQLFATPYLNCLKDAERRSFNLNLNGYAEVDFGKIAKILKGLKYKLNGGYNFLPTRESNYSGRAANDLVGTGSIYTTETSSYTLENIMSYSKDIQKHHFDLTALYSSQERKYCNSTNGASGFVNDMLSFNNLGAGATATSGSYADRYATISQMGRLNYSYDGRYLMTATVRRDGSSVFGANTSKYGVFPSVAIGWNLRNEEFMQNVTWMDQTKIRLSYGKSGNEAIDVCQTITTDANNRVPFEGISTIGMAANTLGNADLTWETTTGANLGIDFGYLGNRIYGTVDMYKSKTTDLLLQRNLPNVSGYSKVYANMGETNNKGIELTLNTRNIVMKDFSWETAVVFARNINKIVDLYGDTKSDTGNRWFIGSPIGVIYDYKILGVWQEDEIANGDNLSTDKNAKAGDLKFKDVNGDHEITAAGDRVILGQTAPKWTGGFTNTFHYKNFNLSMFIQTVQGHMKNNPDLSYADESGRRNTPEEVGYWTPSNKSQTRPSLSYTNSRGYGYPCDASYTRIKDITLSYMFNNNLINKVGVNAMTIYASGRNLYTFTDWIGWDPEAYHQTRGSGSWESNYPNVRSLVIGINVTLK